MRDFIKAKRWAYLAGLVDGDGTICLTEHESPTQVHFFFHVKVASSVRRQINWLVEHFGGQLANNPDKREANRPNFNWIVRGRHAARILEGILPYLVLKKQAAEKGIEYLQLPVGYENPALRSKFAKEMSAINDYFVASEERTCLPLIDRPSRLGKDILSYAAGVLDAEGTFSSPTEKARSPQIQVSSTDQRILDWFYYRFGGIVFSTPKKNGEYRDSGLWRLSGGRCQKPDHLERVKKSKELFLLAIIPYLVQKRRQAILCLSLLRGEVDPASCFYELKSLNAVGTRTANTSSASDEVKIESDPVGDYGCAPLVTAVA